jgi:hypothetical protein
VVGYTEWDVRRQADQVPARIGTINPCDDGDPCTADRWLRFADKCIHVPDPLCVGKTCSTDADCAFEPGQCIDALCHDGTCRLMKIARSECAACDAETPCKSTYCDPRDCQRGFCRHAPRSCGDADPHTRDVCDDEAQTCLHFLADRQRPCQSAAQCETDHPCERFTCKDGTCREQHDTVGCGVATQQTKACAKNQDCISKRGDTCFAGPCTDGFCDWREVENSECQPCTGDHDCLGSFCQWPICTGTVCVIEEVPFCQDDNPLTADTCSEERNGCLHHYRATPPPCTSAPADDGDPGTIDACHTETGETLHLPGSASCETTDLCWVSYLGPDGFCLAQPLQCHHDDACPAECDPSRGCVLDPNRDCHCEVDEDCDLGTPCARVFCLQEDGGACWGTFIDDCIPCESDAECRVDNWCVYGSCSADGYCRFDDGFTCDDGDPDTFGFCHGQRDDPCTYEPIYSYE